MRAGVIITDGRQVLLMRRYRADRGTYFALIGGTVEEDEGAEGAAVREAKEETNLDVTLGERIDVHNDHDDQDHAYFVVREWSGEAKLGGPEAANNSDENRWELVWMPIEHLEAFRVHPEAAVQAFRAYISGGNLPRT